MIRITLHQTAPFYNNESENALRAVQHAAIEYALIYARGKGNNFNIADTTDDGARTVTISHNNLSDLHHGFLSWFSQCGQSLRIECDDQDQYASLARNWDFMHCITGPDGKSTMDRKIERANARLDEFTEMAESGLLMPSHPERDA